MDGFVFQILFVESKRSRSDCGFTDFEPKSSMGFKVKMFDRFGVVVGVGDKHRIFEFQDCQNFRQSDVINLGRSS